MLWQSGAFRANESVDERAMDSMDQERERGITILAKNTAVRRGDLKVNIIDTPGHADFGGEVERGLTMVDGALLLVDASEGPLPQTRFVLGKALERNLPIILVINKIDRPDARIDHVVDAVYELFLELGATEEQIEFPIAYTNAVAGTATCDLDQPGEDLAPLMDLIAEHVPAPGGDPAAPLQAHVTNLDASPYVGRLGLCRVHRGTVRRGQQVAWITGGGDVRRAQVSELYVAEAMERVSVPEARAGDVVAIAGIEDVMIGDTLADPEHPEPLERIQVDEPGIGMVIGVNTSPLVGRSGDKVTARQLQGRLEAELVGNVAIRVVDIGRKDAWEVQGRGEMQLAVLVETLRREGYELTVGKPQVLTREIDGVRCEPVEHVVIDLPDEHVGAATQLLTARKGRMHDMTHLGSGWVRLEYLVPARGLIGFRTPLLSETRGTAILHHSFHGFEPWMGELRSRASGSLIADRPGPVTSYAIGRLEDRGRLFVEPGDEAYEGRIVGEHVRPEDLDVNIVREKHLTNHRSSTADVLTRAAQARTMSLEEALEFIRADEAVEVTPDAIRLRKLVLGATDRHVARSKAAKA